MTLNRNLAYLLLLAGGIVLLGTDAAWAQEATPEGNTFFSVAAKAFAGGIGAGLVVIGGAAGIGRIGSAAVEAMARQPEMAGNISTAMLITAAMIEGATLFAVLGCFIAVIA